MLSTTLLFGFVAAITAPVLCCQTKEYRARDGQCCPKCHEGTVVRRDCTQQSGTRCSPCDNGTYMDRPNGLNKCLSCTSCVQANGLFAQQNCTATTDAVCDVLKGYFCKSLADDTGCSMAEKHTRCARGQKIKEPGTNRTDTKCEDCPLGLDGVNCTALPICPDAQDEANEGGPTIDVVCRSAARNCYFLFTPLLLILPITVVWLVTAEPSFLCFPT